MIPVFAPTAFMPKTTGAFDPVSLITGAGGFWRANAGVTTSGSNVTQWNDQSSFAHNLTNSGTASNVTFSATGFNSSFSGVTLADGTNGAMQIIAPFASTPTASAFMLMMPSTGGSNNRWTWIHSTINDYATPDFITYAPSANSFIAYSNGALGNGGIAFPITSGTPVLVGAVFDGTNCNVWKNGAVVGSGSAFSSNLGNSTSVSFGIGASPDGSSAGGTYAFWGLTQKVLSSTDWTNLKNYCNTNWGTSF